MIDYPENYEEAKQIIINSTTDEISEHNKRAYKLRGIFVSAVGVAATLGLSAVTREPAVLALLPGAGLLGLSSLLSLYGYNKAVGHIQDGSYFEVRSEEEVMESARKYVDTYNDYERKHGGMQK